jgi:ribosomal protein L37E
MNTKRIVFAFARAMIRSYPLKKVQRPTTLACTLSKFQNSCKIRTYIWETKLEGGLHIGPMGLLQTLATSGGLHIGQSPMAYTTLACALAKFQNSSKMITYIWETKLEGGLHIGPMGLLQT